MTYYTLYERQADNAYVEVRRDYDATEADRSLFLASKDHPDRDYVTVIGQVYDASRRDTLRIPLNPRPRGAEAAR